MYSEKVELGSEGIQLWPQGILFGYTMFGQGCIGSVRLRMQKTSFVTISAESCAGKDFVSCIVSEIQHYRFTVLSGRYSVCRYWSDSYYCVNFMPLRWLYGTYAGTEVAMDALTESKYVRLRPYVSYIRGSRDVVWGHVVPPYTPIVTLGVW